MQDSTRRAPVVYWLTEAFFPPLVGGQELIASYLAQGLHARGLQVQVITRQTLPASPARENIQGVAVRRLDGERDGPVVGAGRGVLGRHRELEYVAARGRGTSGARGAG